MSMDALKKGFQESSRLMEEKVMPQVKEYALKFRAYSQAFYETVKEKAEQFYQQSSQRTKL